MGDDKMTYDEIQIEDLKRGIKFRNYTIRSFILLTAILLFLLSMTMNSGYIFTASIVIGVLLLIVQVSIWSCG